MVFFSAKVSIACSGFLLKCNNAMLIGFNEDLWDDCPGMIVTNQRNTFKQGTSWEALNNLPLLHRPTISWTSKFSSITFNALGKEFPLFGLNEKGLFAVELGLDETKNPNDNTKAHIFWAQWIQFLLDNYNSVSDLMGDIHKAPIPQWWPNFMGSHLFLADKTGHSGTLEFIDGKLVTHWAENMPVQALCNNTYDMEMDSMKLYREFGGQHEIDYTSTHWRTRFARAYGFMKKYENKDLIAPVDTAWSIVHNLQLAPKWQIVIDLKSMIWYFKSSKNQELRYFNIASIFNHGAAKNIMLDIDTNLKGNVTHRFIPWTIQLNDEFIAKGVPASLPKELRSTPQKEKTFVEGLNNYAFQTCIERK